MFARCLRYSGLFRRIALLLGCGGLIAGLALIVAPATRAQQSGGPIVTVTGGQVQGQFMRAPGGAVFKGIPYAAPPAGDLRWRETQPVKPWTGVLQTGEFRHTCGEVPSGSDSAKTNPEDCLYLNVWTPAWPATGKTPVMFWVSGGELYGGGSGTLMDGSESLVRHGVIMVAANYRGSLLGMMAHPELTAESPHHSSGNYSILDEIAALRWIHENIARFGGDPNNVTLFGQSGGARIVSFLVTSPLTKGLINRAIVESGAAAVYTRPIPDLHGLEQSGVFMAKALHAPRSTDPIKYLRGLPASEIMDASKLFPEKVSEEAASKQMSEMGDIRYDEGIDGYAIPQSPPEVYRSHDEAPVPMIIGSTAHDSGTITGVSDLRLNASPEEVRAWVKQALETFYGKYPDLLKRAEKIYGLRGSPNEVSTYPPYGPIEWQLRVDLRHRCAVQTTALWHGAIAPTYTYEFSDSIPGHPPSHSSELRFVFGFLSNDEVADEKAHKLADVMQQYWTNFAKTGDPNGPGLPVWPKYTAATKHSIEFTNDGAFQRTASRAVACAPYIEEMARLPKPLLTR